MTRRFGVILICILAVSSCANHSRFELTEDDCVGLGYSNWELRNTWGSESFITIKANINHSYGHIHFSPKILNSDDRKPTEIKLLMRVYASVDMQSKLSNDERIEIMVDTDQNTQDLSRISLYCGDNLIHSTTEFEEFVVIKH